MEAYHDRERKKKQPDDRDHKLQEKMAELVKIREELHRAKDNAMQSWLDSKPLIDELEKLQAGFASAKNRTSMSNVVISELESQLEAISVEIKTRVDKESKARETMDKLNQATEQKYEELEAAKLDADEERRARSKLKQILRLRRQTLRTLQLTLLAVRMESEAFESSEADAIRYIKTSGTDNTSIRIEQGEYHAVKRRAKEETALAEWRTSVSIEQKLEAEESRNLALSRLKELKRKKSKEATIIEDEQAEELEQKSSQVEVNNGNGMDYAKARAKEIANTSNRRKVTRRTARKSRKKKRSILGRIRSFLVRSIARFFN